MTELPPIIERLDTEIAGTEGAFEERQAYGRYGPELRAELLRLQAERDRALQQRDYENEERRTSVALLDEAYRQNCALLEALKAIRDEDYPSTACPNCAHPINEHSLRPNGPCLARRGSVGPVDCGCRLGSAQALAAAIASVEGKDG